MFEIFNKGKCMKYLIKVLRSFKFAGVSGPRPEILEFIFDLCTSEPTNAQKYSGAPMIADISTLSQLVRRIIHPNMTASVYIICT